MLLQQTAVPMIMGCAVTIYVVDIMYPLHLPSFVLIHINDAV